MGGKEIMLLMEYKNSKLQSDINNPVINKIIDYINEKSLDNVGQGIHTINDNFYYNVIEMNTTIAENREWESHKEFYDVHLILEGSERIQFNYLSNMNLEEYDAKNDWQKMNGNFKFDFILEEGDLLLLEPNDAHKTGIIINAPAPIRKVLFKVHI